MTSKEGDEGSLKIRLKRKDPGPTKTKETGMAKTGVNDEGQEYDLATGATYTNEPDILPTERSSTRSRIAQEAASDRAGYRSQPVSYSSSSTSSSSSSSSSGFTVPQPTNPGDFRLYQRRRSPRADRPSSLEMTSMKPSRIGAPSGSTWIRLEIKLETLLKRIEEHENEDFE
jgi:hypothetical protein